MGSEMCIRDRRKYSARSWTIRHLKRIGLDKTQLCRVYAALIRPVIEYAAPVYHHMLSDELSEDLERMQRMVLKVILGMNTPYREVLEESGLLTLENRRKKLALNFALTCAKNDRFKEWFPHHGEYKYRVRAPLKYSPIFSMRRILNKFYADQSKYLNDN